MPTTTVRELNPTEFPLAEQVWTHYRNQKADPKTERIFGAFVDGVLAATARCTRHPLAKNHLPFQDIIYCQYTIFSLIVYS